MATQYIALSPLLSGEGSRAFLGLRVADGEASPCALVWVPEAVVGDPEKMEHLRRETARAAKLVHPHIIRVYGLVEIEESQARVVEFADAESMRRVLDVAQRLPTGFAALATVDAALGVQYAHMAGNDDGTPLVHGDLRPETMLISYRGQTKVSGYGALSVAPKEMGGKRVMGRRMHCAPEQILGGRDAVTVQTDVYLLGLILYECLTGTVPFAEDLKTFDQSVLEKPLPLLHSELVPRSLRPVIEKAMAKKGQQRFQTVQELREAIEEEVELPDYSEFAAFLERAFRGENARAARQKVLDQGLSEWVIKRGLRVAAPSAPPQPRRKKPKPAPPPPPPAPEPAAPAPPPAAQPSSPPSKPALAPERAPSPRRAPSLEDEDGPSKPSRRVPWLSIVPWVIIGLGVAFWLGKSSRQPEAQQLPQAPAPGPDAAAVASAPAPESDGLAPSAPSTPEPNDDSLAPTPPAPGKARASKPAALAPSTRPAPPRSALLSISVDPPVDVSIDGKPAGKTPLTAEVAPGTRVLKLSDPSRGILIVKSVKVKPGPNEFSLSLGKGAVVVNCPPGAEVRIDNRVVGTTPLRGPVPVIEGDHRVQVSKNGAKWQQAFSVGDGETMTFDVEISGGGE